MILVGHQPEYLPYLGFFQKAARADRLVLVDHVQFARKDFQNRNYIRGYDGKILLTIPVRTANRFDQPIREVEIDPGRLWARKHWNSIQLCYQRAPFFAKYADELEATYARPWTRLSDVTSHLIKRMLGWLEIDVPVVLSSDLGITAKKTEMLVEMCRKTGADVYVSGQGARDYVDVELLRQAGIRHHFCRFEHPIYPQFHGEFIPQLSALDLLFNCGERAAAILRECVAASPLEDE